MVALQMLHFIYLVLPFKVTRHVNTIVAPHVCNQFAQRIYDILMHLRGFKLGYAHASDNATTRTIAAL